MTYHFSATDLAGLLGATCAAYPLFWLQSFDAEYRIRVYAQPSLESASTLETDEGPRWFSLSAAVWATALGLLYVFSPERCSIDGRNPAGGGAILGAFSIAVAGKTLFGAAGINHKRVLIDQRGKLARPALWWLVDVITPLATNIAIVPFTKLIWFPVFGFLVWLSGSNAPGAVEVIPIYAFLAATIPLLGRLSSLYLRRNTLPLATKLQLAGRPHLRGWILAVVWLVCLASFVLATEFLERTLLQCGAIPGEMPSYTLLLAGLATMQLLAMVVASSAAIAAQVLTCKDG